MKTGHNVSLLGLYTSECCHEELIFMTGEFFPRCVACTNATSWKLCDVITDLSELEESEELLAA